VTASSPQPKPPLPDHLVDYRKFLVTAEQKSQEDFDKAVLTLSGGALGISFTFLKDIVGANPISEPAFLIWAWRLWAGSILCVLFSYFLSHLSLRKAIAQVDGDTIYSQKPGGVWATWTACLNISGAVLFVLGVFTLTYFASINVINKGAMNDRQKATTPATTASCPAAEAPASAASIANTRQEGRTNGGIHSAKSSAPTSKQKVIGKSKCGVG
jgi:hypothetical protein